MKFIPMKSRRVALWLAPLLGVAWFCWELFGPNPAIPIDRATTYITAPLAADGLPDYFEYVRQATFQGVTFENNAAAAIWQIVGSLSELDESQRQLASRQYGVAPWTSAEGAFADLEDPQLRSDAAKWRDERRRAIASAQKDVELTAEGLPELLPDGTASFDSDDGEWVTATAVVAQFQPWSRKEFPPLGAWVDRNHRAFDAAVAAAKLSQYADAMLRDPDYGGPPVTGALYPIQHDIRNVARALCIRAMHRVHDGRLREAHEDLSACRRLGRLVARGPSIVAQLVALAFESTALSSYEALLATETADAELLADIRRNFASLGPCCEMRRAIEHDERIMALDAIVDLLRRPEHYDKQNGGSRLNSPPARFDWPYILREMNDVYDLLGAVHAESDPRRQATLWQEIEAREDAFDRYRDDWLQKILGFVSTSVRTKIMVAKLNRVLTPASGAAMGAVDRTATVARLTDVQAAISRWRLTHGTYPANLDAMVPELLSELPHDAYGELLRYELTSIGYVLYSLGPDREEEPRTVIVADGTEVVVDHSDPNDPYRDRGENDPDTAHSYNVHVPMRIEAWPEIEVDR